MCVLSRVGECVECGAILWSVCGLCVQWCAMDMSERRHVCETRGRSLSRGTCCAWWWRGLWRVTLESLRSLCPLKPE